MSQETTLLNSEELFGDFHHLLMVQGRNGLERSWMWPEEIGHGFMYMIKLRPGIVLGIGDYRLFKKIEISFVYDMSPLIFGYSLSGSMSYTVNFEKGRQRQEGYKPGYSIMAYLPKWQGIARPAAGTQISCVGIYIAPPVLNALIAGRYDTIPTDLRDIVGGDDEKYFCRTSTTIPSIDSAVRQILDCPYQGALKRLFLESKALELITYSMARLASSKRALNKSGSLRPRDVERVHHARELVSRNFRNPPKLLDLARDVGIPHPKLNLCFREVYGTTIFGYLRKMRLNKAKTLLDEGRMNVTEVAYEVGYSSLSHFAKTFKDTFGTAPGSYLREVSHRW
jgi:AraC-like DNA-binding protein